MTKNNGKKFEDNFKKSVEKDGLLFERFKDNGKFDFNRSEDSKTRFSSKNPYDCQIFDSHNLFCCELKSTVNSSMSFLQPVDIKPAKGCDNKMIKYHQVKELLKRTQYENCYPVLILDFANRLDSKGNTIEGGTYSIPIKTFIEWTKIANKSSINNNDAKLIGVEIKRTIKKVNYIYDIKSMINDTIKLANDTIENGYNKK